ncbi:murein biosynthesis integral membrane protein MurJ [Paenibacillus sp. L3-i20]|uniref:murein biosynthesis integral membrane protein MurJ n=1 Tax=Paenibacillus sp. L3-i20 TaxID=2905833 RepID=UPI001EDF4C32|nr:murein biosynthesis integral membrane protein MurJ [Paenibacillus sp. L3-i20]GKU77022.1 putative lipid II flippase MurJ [Paenibacillus sp. L3-i20]
MKKTALIIILITLFSKLLGFVRDIGLSYFYGASSISDAYIISTTIPLTIFGFLGIAISTGYIPMYSKIREEHGEIESIRYTNNLTNIYLVLSTFILVLGILFAKPIVSVFASGLRGESLILAVKFTKIGMISIYFTGMVYIFNSFLQIKGNYVVPALVGFPLNILVIISIYLSSNGDVLLLSIGTVVATASQLLLILPFVYKEGYKYRVEFDIKDKHIKSMAYIAFPAMIGVSVNQINTLVDTTLASQIVTGGISVISYANRFIGSLESIFAITIATIMFPLMSKMVAEKNKDGIKKSLSDAIGAINLLVIPISIGIMVFSEPIVRLLFGRGAFDSQAIILTSNVIFYYSIGMTATGIREVLSRTFYSMQDTKTPTINAAIALVMNIVLNIILSRFMGISGLALATSISAIFCVVLLFISLRKKIEIFSIGKVCISLLKILAASLFMGYLAKLLYDLLVNYINEIMSLIISVGVGALIYLVIIYFMKIEDVDNIMNVLKKRIKKVN